MEVPVTTIRQYGPGAWSDPSFLAALNEHQDLCWTCNDAVHCLDRKTLRRPVQFCEQFDDFVAVKPQFPPRSEGVHSQVKTDLSGICMNCDEQQFCGRGRTGEAVWFCEQYV